MPGNFLPARKSTIAPPPVEMKLNFLSKLILLEEHHRLSPAGNGECAAISPDRAGDGHAAFGILFLLDEAERTAPDDRPRRRDLFIERADRLRANIQNGAPRATTAVAPHKIASAR